jgi:uncharacterized protein involved in outer membrane biogenesis
MKKLKWIFVGLLVLIVIVVGVVVWRIDSIVKYTVESQASSSLNLKTTLGGANVSLLGGSVGLSDLQIASPEGFKAPHMFSLGGIKVGASLGELRNDPITVDKIVIDQPHLVIEQAGGKFNFQVLTDKPSGQDPTSGKPGDGQREEGEPIRLIIREVSVNAASVVVRPGIPGLDQEISIPIPSFIVKDIGTSDGNKNGAAIKEVVMLLVTTLAEKAADSGKLGGDVGKLLKMDVSQVQQQIEKKIGKELEKQLGEGAKPIGDAINKGLGDLLNQNKPKTPATKPNP